MHNVHVKARERAESHGVTALRNVACLVKLLQSLGQHHLAAKFLTIFMHHQLFRDSEHPFQTFVDKLQKFAWGQSAMKLAS